MGYKKYGETFRKVREQRNYSLADFQSIGISKASLSKFERGKTTMSIERVNEALQLMDIGLEEYENFLNDYIPNLSEEILVEIYKANMLGNEDKVRYFFEFTSLDELYFVGLAAKSCYDKLNEEEVEKLTELFYATHIWSYSELCILYFTFSQLNEKDAFYIVRKLLNEKHIIFNSRKYSELVVQVFCQAIFVFSYKGYYKNAKYIVDKVEKHSFVNMMFLNNLYNFCHGYYIFCFKDRQSGHEKIKTALDIFKSIGTKEMASFYQREYEKYVLTRLG